ncbi:hypothetical protein COCCADRAFT_3497 [Bipolaris zeicola 26-R-13]|uniref:Uncharacterized protein n=1 Tax=Cochliobolus carbonum (strain 26-R-13) TaxID=930089 RepID=W6YC66_COCC2|nr:uncharacterized protein COCCADRAFT_3497 [Bipolaris zeicola 26-R-13]EUC35220.1 hypothetical protein COCCADRAFT_3497 [Bipolaris zeicola 26-R-13]
MPAKPVLSWSKRHSGVDPSSRTGLLDTLKRRPSKLVTTTADGKQNGSSTSVAQYDTALASAVNNLHVAVNDMLHSPESINTLCSKYSFVDKPLPSRPRSASVPSLVELPAELPESTPLQGQGYPLYHDPIRTTRSVQDFQNESHRPKMQPACEKVATLDVPKPAIPTLTHARSVPHLNSRYSLTKTTRPSKIPVPSTAATQSGFQGLQRNHSLVDTTLQRLPESSVMKSLPIVTKNDLVERDGRNSDQGVEKRHGYIEVTSSQTSPTSAHSKHAHELESTNASQLQTIAMLQAQFDNLRAAHESHVETLKRSHSVQVASLENQARLLKERMNEEGLQRRSSGDWLHVPVDEGVKKPTNFESLDLDTSFDEILTGKAHSDTFPLNACEMENLKRKLFASPRLETATQNLHLELSLYARDNAALQKEVDSLTAKLNESNESERKLRSTLGLMETKSVKWEEKAKHANKLIDKLTEKIHALKNTTADLEARLEIANTKRLDAEEQLSNWRDKKSPFDLTPAKLRISSDTSRAASGTQTSTGTQTSSELAKNSEAVDSGNPTPDASTSKTEQLQAQVAEKNAYVAELEVKREELQRKLNQLEQEHKRVAVQSDLQYELLKETRTSDKLIEQLRNAVINRESTIMENEEAIHTLTRQLEYHKVLLQAEIRQHTAMKLFVAEEEQPLPELRSLAKGADIDCWIEKLHEHLKREKPNNEGETVADTPEAKIERLRREIDFYVREIILFKLDIKGYRSDIRKLKEMAANKGSSEESGDNREKASATSPVRSTFAPVTPELDAFLNASSIRDHTDILSKSEELSVTPSTPGPSHKSWTGKDNEHLFGLEIPKASQSWKHNSFFATESVRIDSAFSPSPNPNLTSQHSTPSCVLSESLELGQQPDTLNEPTEKGRTTSTAEREAASYRQFIFMSDAPESPPSMPVDMPQLPDDSDLSEQVAEIPFSPCDEATVLLPPQSPTTSVSETDSVISTASDFLSYTVLPTERKPSNASTPSVPFQVAVEPPPAPVLVTPAVATHTLGCSITRGAPFDVKLPASKSEIDETTAPPTLADAPVPQTKIWQEEMPETTESSSSSPTVFAGEEEQSMSLPTIMSRLRGSISSVYSADSVSKPSEQQDTEISESNVLNMLKALQSCPFSLKPKSSSSSLRSFA